MSEQAASPPASPSSTLLTFLVADIRGYTHFAATHGDRAAAALSERFLEVCREVVRAYDGTVFGSAGDQALASFSSAHSALRAALSLQARLAHEQVGRESLLGSGIGLDAGEAIRVGVDYRSNAVNLAARLCSLAGPGEIFASETVLLVAHSLDGLVSADRGEIRLKGLDQPVRVIQLFPEGTEPGSLPPLQEGMDRPTNLPDEATPFIGRSHELADLTALVRAPGVRLVTLTGTGGTGKTRLAVQVAGTLLYAFDDGAFFCDLSRLTDPSLVPSTIAAVLDVQEAADKKPLDVIIEYLRDKNLLLVLDNCEQVLAAASDIAELLDRCREISVLATSRSSLHLTREREYALSPLPVPDLDRLPPLDELQRYDAVVLFIDRAIAARHDFVVTAQNARAVAEICARLDGLPLAIELAAARVKLFPPEALVRRLGTALALLTGGPLDRPDRQQTLRNTIDWSYQLLDGDHRTLFMRLGVFVGGCSLEAVQAVCSPENDLDVVGGLDALVDESLLVQSGPDEPRFTMLETIREFALEQLSTSPDLDDLRSRHAEFFLSLAETADRQWMLTEQREWLDRLEVEEGNLDAAMRFLLDQDDVEKASRLALALHGFRYTRGHWTKQGLWLDTLLERSDVPAPAHGQLLRHAGAIAMVRGEFEKADSLLHESLDNLRRVDDTAGVAATLNRLAILAAYQERLDDAVALLNQSLSAARSSGDERAAAEYLDNLAGVLVYKGDLAGAASAMKESLDVYRKLSRPSGIAEVLRDLGWIALQQDDAQEAVRLLLESVQVARQLHDAWTLIYCLEGLARAAARLGLPERAFVLWGLVDALRQDSHMEFPPEEKRLHDRDVAVARTQMRPTDAARAYEHGKTIGLEGGLDLVLTSPWTRHKRKTLAVSTREDKGRTGTNTPMAH